MAGEVSLPTRTSPPSPPIAAAQPSFSVAYRHSRETAAVGAGAQPARHARPAAAEPPQQQANERLKEAYTQPPSEVFGELFSLRAAEAGGRVYLTGANVAGLCRTIERKTGKTGGPPSRGIGTRVFSSFGIFDRTLSWSAKLPLRRHHPNGLFHACCGCRTRFEARCLSRTPSPPSAPFSP